MDTGRRNLGALAPNILDRQFTASAPNQKWVADFTFVWTAEGWLYVAVVLDLYSRRIIGWSMQPTMTAQLVTDALTMAVWRRGGQRQELLHHSDRGSQGGFNRSSQHAITEVSDDKNRKATVESFNAGRAALAGSTAGRAA